MHAGDPDRSVTTRVVHGALHPSAFESRADVAPALLAEAEALKANLIIVGTGEHPGFAAELGLGSVSRKLVRRASMAVLVVRGAGPA
jgi:nucleotide-binding universal stress UspA family protein